MQTAQWNPVSSITIKPGDSIAVYQKDGTSLLLVVTRVEDDPDFPEPGVVPRIYTEPGIAIG